MTRLVSDVRRVEKFEVEPDLVSSELIGSLLRPIVDHPGAGAAQRTGSRERKQLLQHVVDADAAQVKVAAA